MTKDLWTDRARWLTELLEIKHPIIQAPMAGGPSTPELVVAVSNAGGLGSIGAGYLSPQDLDSQVSQVRKLTKAPFAVNFFIPPESGAEEVSPDVLKKLEEFSRDLDVEIPDVTKKPVINFDEQLDVVIDNKVSVFSFTFGVPEPGHMNKLRQNGIKVIGTATCVREAVELEQAGCHAIVAQGVEAGGHRGTFESTESMPLIGGMALIPQIADRVGIAVIASGGIMDGRGIAASLVLGASAVQMGTAFLTCEEARISPAWLDSLLNSSDTSTVLTKAFSGKFARGINNRFIEEMAALQDHVPPYPIQNSMTGAIRKAAKAKENPDFMSLWAGQGSVMCRRMTAAELVGKLVAETEEALLGMPGIV